MDCLYYFSLVSLRSFFCPLMMMLQCSWISKRVRSAGKRDVSVLVMRVMGVLVAFSSVVISVCVEMLYWKLDHTVSSSQNQSMISPVSSMALMMNLILSLRLLICCISIFSMSFLRIFLLRLGQARIFFSSSSNLRCVSTKPSILTGSSSKQASLSFNFQFSSRRRIICSARETFFSISQLKQTCNFLFCLRWMRLSLISMNMFLHRCYLSFFSSSFSACSRLSSFMYSRSTRTELCQNQYRTYRFAYSSAFQQAFKVPTKYSRIISSSRLFSRHSFFASWTSSSKQETMICCSLSQSCRGVRSLTFSSSAMALVSQSKTSEYLDRSCEGCRVRWLRGILRSDAKIAVISWWVILSYRTGSVMSSINVDYILWGRENRIVLYFHHFLNVLAVQCCIRPPAHPRRGFSVCTTQGQGSAGEGKSIRRLLFQGWTVETYTPYELQKLKEFQDYLQRKEIKLDHRWDKSWKMRFLLSTGCNIKKCIADMEVFIKYQNSVRELSFTKNVAKHIRDGVFYISGRDSHYRPILVFDVEKIIKSEMSEDELIEAQTYFFQYIMRNFLIPGQVENWVSIIDAASIGVFSLVSSMKKSFSFLSDTYRSRMFVCYVVRIPTSLSFVWSVVKRFLEEETVKKINFFDDQTIQPLLEFCNPSQLEKKFGGTLENIAEGHFWPPREVSKDYHCAKEPIKLLTKQQYTEYYIKKIFYNTKFHEENLIPATGNGKGNEMRDNINLHTIKRIERQFKIELEMMSEDTINFDSDVRPYSSLREPLNFLAMLQTSVNSKPTPPKE